MKDGDTVTLSTINSEALCRTIPINATIELLTCCNLRCEHCYIPEHNSYGLPYEKVLSIIDELKQLGTLELLLTGGEIFLRDDLLNIVQHARNNGMRVTLFSNATRVSEEQIDFLSDLHITEFSCTVFSLNPSIHDGITGVPGSLEQTLHTMSLIRNSGIQGSVKTVVMKKTVNEWKTIYDYCLNKGFHFVAPAVIIPRLNGDRTPIGFRLSYEQIKELYREEMKLGLLEKTQPDIRETDYICDKIHTSVYIDSKGDVYPCNSFYYKIGNIIEKPLSSIWNRTERHKYILSLRKKDLPVCSNCEQRQFCYKCPGNALFESGDFFKCSSTDEVLSRVYQELFEGKEGNL